VRVRGLLQTASGGGLGDHAAALVAQVLGVPSDTGACCGVLCCAVTCCVVMCCYVMLCAGMSCWYVS
jgi:hypothetical protein